MLIVLEIYWCPEVEFIKDKLNNLSSGIIFYQIEMCFSGRYRNLRRHSRRRVFQPTNTQIDETLGNARNLPTNNRNKKLLFLSKLSKVALNYIAKYRSIGRWIQYTSKVSCIQAIIGGKNFSKTIIEASTYNLLVNNNQWPNVDMSMAEKYHDSTRFFNDLPMHHSPVAYMDPFQDSKDEKYPKRCVGYWIKIPSEMSSIHLSDAKIGSNDGKKFNQGSTLILTPKSVSITTKKSDHKIVENHDLIGKKQNACVSRKHTLEVQKIFLLKSVPAAVIRR
jgi:hypothetical protein